MPDRKTGFAAIREIAAENEARRSAAQSPRSGNFQRIRYFKLDPGQTAAVRFLEQGDDPQYAYCAKVPPYGRNRFPSFEPLIDQERNGARPDPLMEANLDITFRGWINLIWRNAPVFRRDGDGRLVKGPDGNNVVDGYEDTVAVWESGITVMTLLGEYDERYRGLMSRDFDIKRKGSGLSTQYVISPTNPDAGPVSMSDNDMVLAQQMVDTRLLATPKTYDELVRILADAGVHAGMSSAQGGDPNQGNVFMQSPFNRQS